MAPQLTPRAADDAIAAGATTPTAATSPAGKQQQSPQIAAATTGTTAAMPAAAPFTLRSAPIRRSSSHSLRHSPSLSLPTTPGLMAAYIDQMTADKAAEAAGEAGAVVSSTPVTPITAMGRDGFSRLAAAAASASGGTTPTATTVDGTAPMDVVDQRLISLNEGAISCSDFAALVATTTATCKAEADASVAAGGAPLLMLDLRSFMQFNQAHVHDAINVCVPTTILKRQAFSLDMVKKGICRSVDKERWCKRAGARVVLYDQSTEATLANPLLVKTFHALREEGQVYSVHWLEGGMCTFLQAFGQHCKVSCLASKLLKRIDLSLACAAPKTMSNATASGPDEPVQILSYLYLGGEKVAGNRDVLKSYNIKYILNTAVECEDNFPLDFTYLRLDLQDTPSQRNMAQLFEQAFKFIDSARDGNERVLVHCRAGQSRSVTVVLAYLMRALRWSVTQAYNYVQRRRPAMSPNLGFMGHLSQYEMVLKDFGVVGGCIRGCVSLPKAAFPATATAALSHVPANVPIVMARVDLVAATSSAPAAPQWPVDGVSRAAPARSGAVEQNPFEVAVAAAPAHGAPHH